MRLLACACGFFRLRFESWPKLICEKCNLDGLSEVCCLTDCISPSVVRANRSFPGLDDSPWGVARPDWLLELRVLWEQFLKLYLSPLTRPHRCSTFHLPSWDRENRDVIPTVLLLAGRQASTPLISPLVNTWPERPLRSDRVKLLLQCSTSYFRPTIQTEISICISPSPAQTTTFGPSKYFRRLLTSDTVIIDCVLNNSLITKQITSFVILQDTSVADNKAVIFLFILVLWWEHKRILLILMKTPHLCTTCW